MEILIGFRFGVIWIEDFGQSNIYRKITTYLKYRSIFFKEKNTYYNKLN